ncbi:MAG: hypothetical protein J5781_06485 [Clostridia bacterium]|nr:hypothetical protein [Clostridia bacterium]
MPTVVFLAVFITMLVLADNHYFAYKVQVSLEGSEHVTIDRESFFCSLIASTGAVGFAFLLLTIIYYVDAVRKYDCCGVKKARIINISTAVLIILAFVGSFFCFMYNANYIGRYKMSKTSPAPTSDGSEPVAFENEEDFLRWAQTIVINEDQANESLIPGEYVIDWYDYLHGVYTHLDLYIPYNCETARDIRSKNKETDDTDRQDNLYVTFIKLKNDFYLLELTPSLVFQMEFEPEKCPQYPNGETKSINDSYEAARGTYVICHLITAETHEYAPEEYASYLPAKEYRGSSDQYKPVYYFYPVCKYAPVYYQDEYGEYLFCRTSQYHDVGIYKESGALIVTKTIVYPGYDYMTDTYGMLYRETPYFGRLVALVFAIAYAAAIISCILIYRKVCAGKKPKA